MTDRLIHLGYELGTAEPVAIPLKHMAVTACIAALTETVGVAS